MQEHLSGILHEENLKNREFYENQNIKTEFITPVW